MSSTLKVKKLKPKGGTGERTHSTLSLGTASPGVLHPKGTSSWFLSVLVISKGEQPDATHLFPWHEAPDHTKRSGGESTRKERGSGRWFTHRGARPECHGKGVSQGLAPSRSSISVGFGAKGILQLHMINEETAIGPGATLSTC